MDEGFLLIVVGGGIVMTLLGWMIGANRGRPGAGFLCGFLLGPLGVVLALFLPKGEVEGDRRKRGGPTRRVRSMPIKMDPLEAWESKERAKTLLQVPEHLRGKRVDED